MPPVFARVVAGRPKVYAVQLRKHMRWSREVGSTPLYKADWQLIGTNNHLHRSPVSNLTIHPYSDCLARTRREGSYGDLVAPHQLHTRLGALALRVMW